MAFARVLSTLWDMLDGLRRAKFLSLSVLLFVASTMELLGMLALFGYIQGLSSNAVTGHRSGKLARVLEHLFAGPLDDYEYALAGGVCLIGIMLVRNLSATVVRFLLNRFLMKLNHQVSAGLFEGYMRAPYERIKTGYFGNPAENVITTFDVFSTCFAATAQVLADAVMLTMVISLLVFVDPWLTLGCALVFLLAGSGLYRVMQRTLVRMGRTEVYSRHTSRAYLNDGIRGIIEARLRNAAGFFVSRYASSLRKTTLIMRRKAALARLPRSSNEMLLTIVIVGAVFYVTLSGSDMHAALPTLGLFGFAGLKLTSAMSRINSSLQHLRQKAEQFESAYRAVLQVAPQVFREADARPENDYLRDENPLPEGFDGRMQQHLELKNVHFGYLQGGPPAIQDVSLRIDRGTFVSFCGSSGGGKSTLLLLIMGIMRPQSGSIECDGRDIFTFMRSWHRNIGYVGQHVFIASASVKENVAFGVPKTRIDNKKVWRALEQAAAADFVRELPKGLNEPLKDGGARLSGGQRQRISIARALYHDPDIIVFDEATAALDNITESEITNAIARLAGTKTVICVAHRLSTIRGSDVIHLVEKGRIIASGSYDELLETSPEFSRMARTTPHLKEQEPSDQVLPLPEVGSTTR